MICHLKDFFDGATAATTTRVKEKTQRSTVKLMSTLLTRVMCNVPSMKGKSFRLSANTQKVISLALDTGHSLLAAAWWMVGAGWWMGDAGLQSQWTEDIETQCGLRRVQ